ncbi:hypothetical protein [Mariniphaga anaerophila]|nr:hypothetical protein [Mariniphaga anaerophila]
MTFIFTFWLASTGFRFLIFLLLPAAVFLTLHFRQHYKKKELAVVSGEQIPAGNEHAAELMKKSKEQLIDSLQKTNAIYSLGMSGFLNEDLISLRDAENLKKILSKKLDKNKVYSPESVIDSDSKSGHYYIQLKDYQMRMAGSLTLFLDPLYEHLSNTHRPFVKSQAEELNNLIVDINLFLSHTVHFIKHDDFGQTERLVQFCENLNKGLESMGISQIKRIKTKLVNNRNSTLFLNTLTETKNMLSYTLSLIKTYRKLATVLQKAPLEKQPIYSL